MKIDVYKSNKSSKYLIVPAGTNVAELTVSDVDMATVSTFKKGITIDPQKPLIGLDYKAALAEIEIDGYYIQSIKINITVD